MKEVKYYIHWDFGVHRAIIETNERDFFEVIDDMKTEFDFEITSRGDYIDLQGNHYTYTDYKICNYHGEWQIIGQTQTKFIS